MAYQYQHPRIPATRWRKPRTCFTRGGNAKRRYATRAEARRIARTMSRQSGERLVAYWCPECDGGCWHVGHEG